MTHAFMPVYLSAQPADAVWGENALISPANDGITIHLTGQQKANLDRVQRAGRKIDGQGIKHVKLAGDGWDLEHSWRFWQGFRAPKGEQEIAWPALTPDAQQALEQRLATIDWVRDTINLPAQALTPLALVQRTVDLFSELAGDAIDVRLLQGEALREAGYQGIYHVGRGAENVPALLTLDYNPTGNPDAPVFACLVGKGITFDSGGYSLKPSQFMDSMKSDMGGAATLAGGLALAIRRGLTQRVKLILCCAENLVSGSAFKLGDIIHYRNGKTVEVMNTDAEGRLVLADGLIDADAQQPQLIVDCATLTGAAKTALGNDYHALLSFDDELANQLLASAAQENEAFWRLPLAECHRNQLSSNFAQLSNVAGSAHSAGASTAAGFLSHFVKHYQKGWLHIDCAATYRKSAVEQWAAGATGVGVRTIAHFLLHQR